MKKGMNTLSLICNKTSHFKVGRPILKKYKFKKSGSAYLVSEAEDTYCYENASVLAISRTHSEVDWIIDYGCAVHICPPKNNS